MPDNASGNHLDPDDDPDSTRFDATFKEIDVDLSPWMPLLGVLDATDPDASSGDQPFTPAEGVERAHAIELRAESMLQYAERGAQRTGELDRTEVGLSDDNRDVVAGRDDIAIDGMLDEHTGRGLVQVADEVEMNVGGPLRMRARLEDNIIMAGVMRDEFAGGTFVTAVMSDDMAAGLGLRCTAPLDVWVHGVVGMEERPGTCAADGLLFELAGTLYEREYGPSAHVAAVARHQGTVVSTMKTKFRPLMKVALGVRNLIPGGGGGGGNADAAPPAAPPAAGGGEAAGATLTAAESGGAIGRGTAGADDTDEIVSVVRTVENASDGAEVEELQHPANTADNLDDLARVDVEGPGGPQQVAEIYEQPVPASAASGTNPDPAGAVAAPSGTNAGRPPPPLELTEPGTEGYDFGKAYGSLRDRHHFYRQDLNLRGNMLMGDALADIDKKAIELFENLGGSLDDVTGDYRSRTAGIVNALEQMAEQADAAGDVGRAADMRGAIDEIEGITHSSVVEFASRTDEFSGAAIGSQRAPIDSNIDTGKLRRWLQEQKGYAEAKFGAAMQAGDMANYDNFSKEMDYFDQMIKSLDAGENPLNESGEQIAFVRRKIQDHYAKYTDDIAAAAADGWDFIPPRPIEENHLDLFLDQHDRLIATLSDPEYMRSAQRMPSPVNLTAPGAQGYDFRRAYDSIYNRYQYYRNQFSFRGNFFTREHLREIDAKSIALFQGFGGSADEVVENSFSYRSAGIHDALKKMAGDAEAAGDANRAADIRAAMDEIEGLVNRRLTEVAARTDEFSGTALGSQRAPIDRNIDTDRLRSWAQGRMQDAMERQSALPMEPEVPIRMAGMEISYYHEIIRCLDEGVNPIASVNEQIAGIRINMIEPHRAQFADEVAAAARRGEEFVIPRIQADDEFDLYVRLQGYLVETLSDPAFHRSAEAMGDDAFNTATRARVNLGFDPMPNLRPPLTSAGGPPPLPGASVFDDARYIDEVRDRSFSRSALGANEQMLERHVAGLAEPEAMVRSGPPPPGAGSEVSGTPELSVSGRRASPDNAQAPVIDERSGRWVVDPSARADGVSTPSQGGRAPSQESDVLWQSGVRVSGDSEIGPGAGNVGEADSSNLLKASSADSTPAGTSASNANEGATATRSNLYSEPVSLEGRSLEGASRSDDPKELARSLDGAEVPVEDLPRADPARKSILKNSDARPVSDSYWDVDEVIRHRFERAQDNKRMFNDGTGATDSAWTGTLGSTERSDVAALREADARWPEFAAAQRRSSASFSDDSRQLLYRSEHERTVYSRSSGRNVDLYRGADPPNTIDRAHATHYIPRPRDWETARETEFGRLSHGWNEFPFSHRERILNTLHRGEALSPDQIISLELGLESYRAAGGELSSSQYRAMVDMISDLGDQHRHARWSTQGEGSERLLQLVEMLDYAAAV